MLMGLPHRWDACSRTISLQGKPSAFAYQGDTIAVGLGSSVELLDAITGVRTSALRGHIGAISSVAFSPDGTLLVSTSKDDIVNLWDIQTGGIIGTLSSSVSSVSISPDNTRIVLGAPYGLIKLWDVRTGDCSPIETRQGANVEIVRFSPADPRRFISSILGFEPPFLSRAIKQWDVDGNHIGPHYQEAFRVVDLAYAPDGTRVVLCGRENCTVRDSESWEVLNTFSGQSLSRCCFSPDGRFVACSGDRTIDIWHATIPGTTPVETFVGHSDIITFLAFSSSLISGSSDQSVKFWQRNNSPAKSTPTMHGSAPINSVKLFAQESTVVTSDESGRVKTWDLTTGTRISSFSTPAEGPCDTHLEGDTLIIVWRSNRKQYHIWDVYKRRYLRKFKQRSLDIRDIKISGDGSTIFGLTSTYIEALGMESAEARRVEFDGRSAFEFFVRGSRVWISGSGDAGWDFGTSDVPSFGEFPDRPRLGYLADWTKGSAAKPRWIEDTVTKRVVFHFPGKYRKPDMKVEWDGRYLLVWSKFGEVAVIDFDSVQCVIDETR